MNPAQLLLIFVFLGNGLFGFSSEIGSLPHVTGLASLEHTGQCRLAPTCTPDESCIIAIQNSSGGNHDSHAQACSIGDYAWKICCKEISAYIQASCSNPIFSFQDSNGGITNAHVGEPGHYINQVCTDHECQIKRVCSQGQECLFEFESTTGTKNNAHVFPCSSGMSWSLCCGTASGWFCGDGFCDTNETVQNCPADCYVEICGNGVCGPNETIHNCPQDCNITGVCGNGLCEDNETPQNCPDDCIEIICGDGLCEPGETPLNCPQDCNITGVCGNGVCEQGETAANCPADCSRAPVCGDYVCEGSENPSNCPQDCSPKTMCGNGMCEQGETAANCPADCARAPVCGDYVCEGSENPSNCPQDCLSEREASESEKQAAERPESETEDTETDGPTSILDYSEIKGYWLWLVLALVVSCGAAVYLLSRRKPAKDLTVIAKKNDVSEPHDYVNKLTTYMNNALIQGYDKETISAQLLKQGWKKKQIDDAFVRLEVLNKYNAMKGRRVVPQQLKKRLAKEYKKEQINNAFTHYSADIGLNPSQAQQMQHLQSIAKQYNMDSDGDFSKAVSYIRKCYAYGYNRNAIEKAMRTHGWDKDQIDKAFSKIL